MRKQFYLRNRPISPTVGRKQGSKHMHSERNTTADNKNSSKEQLCAVVCA